MLARADAAVYTALSEGDRELLRGILLSLCAMDEDKRARAIADMDAELLRLIGACGPLTNEYMPHDPSHNFKQWVFLSQLLNDVRDVFYGGAAGGAKSDSILAGGLQFVHVPGYAAIILRKTYQDLSLPGALMHRAKEWLGPTDALWSEKLKTWTFPSGASLTFGYLEHAGDEERYQSSEFQYVGWDEGSQIPERQMDYVNSRCRRPAPGKPNAAALSRVPLRTRVATNPGGISHNTLKARYIDPARQGQLPKGVAVIRASLQDNPFLDRASYEDQLNAISDPTDRARLKDGDWDVLAAGGLIQREWIKYQTDPPAELAPGVTQRGSGRLVRKWDLAGTKPNPADRNPDWTVGALMGLLDGKVYILDAQYTRDTPYAVETLVRQTAETDGKGVPVHIEQEPGQSGKAQVAHYKRKLVGWTVSGKTSTGSKETRVGPLASAAEAGNLIIVTDYYGEGKVSPWVRFVVDQLVLFPNADKDDVPDALAGGLEYLTPTKGARKRRPVPVGMASAVAAGVQKELAPVTEAQPIDYR